MSEKNHTISAIRMICTISIVTLHIFQQYETLVPSLRIATDWLNLGLVMFFCISAFLYSQREIYNVSRWLIRRYRDLVIPSILVGIVALLIAFLSKKNIYPQIGGALLSCLGLQVWANDSWLFIQLWFLTYILFCYLSVPLIQKIPCKTCSATRFWVLLISASFALQIIVFALESLLNVELLSVGVLLRFYLPYFLFRRYDIHGKPIKKIMCILSAVSLLAILLTCLCRYTTYVPLPDSIKELVFIYTQTLSGIVCFYWGYMGLSHVQFSPSILRISDTYSYPVYLVHCLFIGYSTSVIRAFHFSGFSVILALLLTALTSILVQKLSELLIKRLRIGKRT